MGLQYEDIIIEESYAPGNNEQEDDSDSDIASNASSDSIPDLMERLEDESVMPGEGTDYYSSDEEFNQEILQVQKNISEIERKLPGGYPSPNDYLGSKFIMEPTETQARKDINAGPSNLTRRTSI